MAEKKQVAILRTKGEILTARDLNNFKIDDAVLKKPEFEQAKMTDMFGFKLIAGSDWRIVECQSVQNNSSAFFDYAFGQIEVKDIDSSINK